VWNHTINYGAAAPKLVETLKVDFTTARALLEGYKKSFAGVVDFGKWISNRVYITNNIPNLLLRRYYSRNKHLLQNWLVQGSGADILLTKLRDVYEYIKDKPHWNFMITIHDEIGLTCKDIPETQLIKEVKEIQSILCHKLSAVDIVADVEYTTTKWSEKTDWKGAEKVHNEES
jgi:DNA polymerase I-like protein with 3'-5' exonuclease and polymerase domains